MYKILLIIVCSCFTSMVFGQKIKEKDVPPKVVAALNKHFPNSKKENWEMVEDRYNATFEVYGKKGKATFSDKGKVLNSEIEISKDDLPFSVGYYIEKNFKGEYIEAASKLKDSAGAVTLNVTISDRILTFTGAGEYVSEVSTIEEEIIEESVDN